MQALRRIFGIHQSADATDPQKTGLHCIVQLLDGEKGTYYLQKRCQAKELYDRVYTELDFQCEHDYFALQFTDFHGVRHWLDPTKELQKQVKARMAGPPFTFRFLVKFYSSEPDSYLKEELTRYLFVQQLRSDLREGRLVCKDEEKAAELAALIIQAEEDDYDQLRHTASFVSQFKFLPEPQQTEAFELRVLTEYRKLANRNLNPAMCERMYLNKVKYLENYGVDMHVVNGKDKRNYKLGLTPAGILVYDRDEKIGLFFWPRIIKIEFNRAKLKIIVTEDDNQGAQQDHVFVFNLADTRACKHLWRCAVEHHSFFRLFETRGPPTKAKQLLRMRSRFYHSFRTESGMVQERQFGTSQRRSARFERRPSTRYSSRPSFARADAERRLHKTQEREDMKKATLERVMAAEEDAQPPSVPSAAVAAAGRASERIQTKAIVSSMPRAGSNTSSAVAAPATVASTAAANSHWQHQQHPAAVKTPTAVPVAKRSVSSEASSNSSISSGSGGSSSDDEDDDSGSGAVGGHSSDAGEKAALVASTPTPTQTSKSSATAPVERRSPSQAVSAQSPAVKVTASSSVQPTPNSIL